MRDGDRPGLLRVVHEVALPVVLRLLGDDLDRVLVRAHGAVAAQPEEHPADHVVRLGVELRVHRQREVRDVVHDADGEVRLGRRLRQLVEDRLDAARREFLRGQAVAAAGDPRVRCEGREAGVLRLAQGRQHVQVERLADGARLLGAVEHADRPDALRQRGDELPDRERAVEADLHHPHLLAPGDQPVHRLVSRLGTRAHQDDDALGLRMADVVEQVVRPPDPSGEVVHGLLDDPGAAVVEGVAGLARLEEDVRVLRGAAQDGAVRRQGALPVLPDQLVGEHGAQVVVAQQLDLGDLVRGAEPVEEVQQRDARAQRRRLADEGHVVRLLDRARGEEREAGLAAGHHVRVVPEDRERVRGHGAGGDVHAVARELAGDLVHVGDHQQQALRRRERRGQRTGLQRPVHGPRRAPLRLHLDDVRDGAPDVAALQGRPLVGPFPHVRGRGDGIDGDDLVGTVGDRRGRLVAVHRDQRSAGHGVLLVSRGTEGALPGGSPLRHAAPAPPRAPARSGTRRALRASARSADRSRPAFTARGNALDAAPQCFRVDCVTRVRLREAPPQRRDPLAARCLPRPESPSRTIQPGSAFVTNRPPGGRGNATASAGPRVTARMGPIRPPGIGRRPPERASGRRSSRDARGRAPRPAPPAARA